MRPLLWALYIKKMILQSYDHTYYINLIRIHTSFISCPITAFTYIADIYSSPHHQQAKFAVLLFWKLSGYTLCLCMNFFFVFCQKCQTAICIVIFSQDSCYEWLYLLRQSVIKSYLLWETILPELASSGKFILLFLMCKLLGNAFKYH